MLDDLPSGLRAFVTDDVALLPVGLSDADREQLFAILVERRDTARLDRLGSSPDRALAKAARKALHLLRTRGAAPKVVPARVYRVEGPFAEPDVSSWATIIDGRGERVVWYVESGDSGFGVFEVEVSETHGILSLTAVDVGRKAWREQLAVMQRSDRALVGEISGAHARVLLETAYRRMLADGRGVPETFGRFHIRLQASTEELAAPHPLRVRLGHVEASDAELAAVLERPELALLVPTKDAITALDQAIGEIVTSTLELDPAQKRARLEDAVLRVVDETTTPAVRQRLADRLLELGLVIASRSPGDLGPARACLAAADRVLDASRPAHDHPTLVGMFRRLIPAELLLTLGGA